MLINDDFKRKLVSLIVSHDKSVVQQKSRVALDSIAVHDLSSVSNVLQRLDQKPILVLSVGPRGHFGMPMVEHISQRDESIGFGAVYSHSEDSRTD